MSTFTAILCLSGIWGLSGLLAVFLDGVIDRVIYNADTSIPKAPLFLCGPIMVVVGVIFLSGYAFFNIIYKLPTFNFLKYVYNLGFRKK